MKPDSAKRSITIYLLKNLSLLYSEENKRANHGAQGVIGSFIFLVLSLLVKLRSTLQCKAMHEYKLLVRQCLRSLIQCK